MNVNPVNPQRVFAAVALECGYEIERNTATQGERKVIFKVTGNAPFEESSASAELDGGHAFVGFHWKGKMGAGSAKALRRTLLIFFNAVSPDARIKNLITTTTSAKGELIPPFMDLPLCAGTLNVLYDKMKNSHDVRECRQAAMAAINELVRVRRLVLDIHRKAAPVGTNDGDSAIAALAAAAYEPTWAWCNDRRAELLEQKKHCPLTMAELAELAACIKCVESEVQAVKANVEEHARSISADVKAKAKGRCSCGKQMLGVYEGNAEYEFDPKCKKCRGTGVVTRASLDNPLVPDPRDGHLRRELAHSIGLPQAQPPAPQPKSKKK